MKSAYVRLQFGKARFGAAEQGKAWGHMARSRCDQTCFM
jgi:hypothetical protein